MYQKRREKLTSMLPEHAIALFFSGKAPYKVGDEKYAFSVDRSFYYLTGLDKENMVLVLVKHGEVVQEYLCIERYDEELAKWVGGRMMPEDAASISGVKEVYWLEELMDVLGTQLSRIYDHNSQVDVYADYTKQEPYQSENEAFRFTRELLAQYPYVQLHNVASKVTQLRLIKDESEIEKLKKAIEITDQGIQNMMKHVHPGMSENQVEAYFDFVLKTNNAHHSFPSIVASGKNATILHYADNNQNIKKNSLILCDLGAAYEYMNADITRTFPASGKFTKRQKEVYNVVLQGNKYIMSLVKPGVTLRELNNELIAYYQKEIKNLGLAKHGKDVSDYYWHGVSHMLGLETHDVALSNYPLQPGNVFTIEPGLYIEEESLGIRIEDNVLVNENGCINLSENIIKEVEDIEAFMATYNSQQ